jgi:outer membrane protein assembly factor BamE (lipoprotein component of BamABCDE complex)
MKKIILVFICIMFVIGCASSGQYFTIDNANQIKNGMTREEVIAIMGTNPYQITDQGKTFVWSYAQVGATGRMESRAVKFNFDENGKTYGVPAGGAYGDTQKYLDK